MDCSMKCSYSLVSSFQSILYMILLLIRNRFCLTGFYVFVLCDVRLMKVSHKHVLSHDSWASKKPVIPLKVITMHIQTNVKFEPQLIPKNNHRNHKPLEQL